MKKFDNKTRRNWTCIKRILMMAISISTTVLVMVCQCNAAPQYISLENYGIKSIPVQSNYIYVTPDNVYNAEELELTNTELEELQIATQSQELILGAIERNLNYEITITENRANEATVTELMETISVDELTEVVEEIFAESFGEYDGELIWAKYEEVNGYDYIVFKYTAIQESVQLSAIQYIIMTSNQGLNIRIIDYSNMPNEVLEQTLCDFISSITYNDLFNEWLAEKTKVGELIDSKNEAAKKLLSNAGKAAIEGAIFGGLIAVISFSFRKFKKNKTESITESNPTVNDDKNTESIRGLKKHNSELSEKTIDELYKWKLLRDEVLYSQVSRHDL